MPRPQIDEGNCADTRRDERPLMPGILKPVSVERAGRKLVTVESMVTKSIATKSSGEPGGAKPQPKAMGNATEKSTRRTRKKSLPFRGILKVPIATAPFFEKSIVASSAFLD